MLLILESVILGILLVIALILGWLISSRMDVDSQPVERPLLGLLISAASAAAFYAGTDCYPGAIVIFTGAILGFLAEATRRDMAETH